MNGSKMSKGVTLAAVVPLALAFSGCGDQEADETAYCVDAHTEQVTQNQYCNTAVDRDGDGYDDNGGSHVWLFYSGSGALHSGQSSRGLSGQRIAASNKAAIASRGGFGSSAKAGGVGRATAGA